MTTALFGRGRIKGRRNKRIKECVWESLAANAARGKILKLKTKVCLEKFRRRLLGAAWGWFRTKCKAVAVKAMVERRKMVSFFDFLSLRLRLRTVRNGYVVSKGFRWWKRATNMRMAVRRVTEAYHRWIAEKMFAEWRWVYVGEKVSTCKNLSVAGGGGMGLNGATRNLIHYHPIIIIAPIAEIAALQRKRCCETEGRNSLQLVDLDSEEAQGERDEEERREEVDTGLF